MNLSQYKYESKHHVHQIMNQEASQVQVPVMSRR
jgi:hypothetical protein